MTQLFDQPRAVATGVADRVEPASPVERPRVLVLLSRGETLRNFVYSGVLDALSETADVSVASVEPNAEIWSDLADRVPDLSPLPGVTERWPVRFVRQILDMAHGRWLWSKAARARWQQRDEEASASWSARIVRAGKKAIAWPFTGRRGLSWLSWIEEKVARTFPATVDPTELLERTRPDLVFNASHSHSLPAIPVVHAARRAGIPTSTFIFSWDNLTSQGRIVPEHDSYLVWNDGLRDQLLEIYDNVSPEDVHVTGTPQFDFHFRPEMHWSREEFCRRVGADPDRPIVLYSTGMANHVYGEPEVCEQLVDMLEDMTDLGSPQLLIRVYPKGEQRLFDHLADRAILSFPKWERNWLTPTEEDVKLLTNTLRHADVGINVASTISLELCMFDKPVLNVGYRPNDDPVPFDYVKYYDFDHYSPVARSGAIEIVPALEAMPEAIRTAIVDPGRNSAKRQALVDSMFAGAMDGDVASRVAGTLSKLAERCATTRERTSKPRR